MTWNSGKEGFAGCAGTAPVGKGRIAIFVSFILFLTGRVGAATVSFSGPTNYPVGTQPAAVATGDFNADGKADLAVVNTGSNDVSILLGNRDGTLQVAQSLSVGNSPIAIVVL
jgi:FG-GAP repeat protein